MSYYSYARISVKTDTNRKQYQTYMIEREKKGSCSQTTCVCKERKKQQHTWIIHSTILS
jgi:hypothetical protein